MAQREGCAMARVDTPRPITLANGEQRTFLEDGDQVILTGRCERAGFRSIGFGHCAATIVAP